MAARCFEVKSDWLPDQASRLDAAAYAEGGLAARDRIKAGPWPWCALGELARIFSETRFARTYVSDQKHGVPYLTGSDMLLCDLSGLLILSRRQTPQLTRLLIRPTWTLMSCSGTVGRTVFVRQDMDSMVLSHDVIRIVGQKSRVLSGYLFAFLTSAPAQAMIRQHTYGSVVQHIEPHHLTGLPVPLPEVAEQRRIHELVQRAAAARAEASRLLDQASGYFGTLAGSFRYAHEHALAAGIVRRSELRQTRLDAFTHTGWAAEGRNLKGERLSSLAEVSRPGIIKRLFAERGTPFVSGVDVFQLRPEARSRLRSDEAVKSGAVIEAAQILVQRSGQRYGLLGRPAYVGKRLDGWAGSEDLVRITSRDPALVGRLFAFLRSEAGRRQLISQSYGTSIPHINPEGVASLKVPSLPLDLATSANRALELREQADADEERAIREVEAWLG
jgi:type I restriction enzyme S subunit